MKVLAKNKIDRKETRVYNLIDNVDVSANKVNSEESAVFVESVGGLLNSEAQTLDTQIDDLAVLDPELASRAENLRCAASASAMKAMSSVMRYRNEDGAASKCSAGSFVPRRDPLLVVPRRTGQPPMLRLPRPMHKNPEMLQSHCLQKRSPPLGRSTGREIRHLPQKKTTLVDQRRTTGCPQRMPKASTENGVNTMRIGGDGRRMPNATRPGMGGETTRRSCLVGVEEEQAKEMEEGSHHHPEEMEINLVVNTDRPVSLRVTLPGPRLLMFFPHSLSALKNRRDHLLHRSQLLKIPIRIFDGFVRTCGLTLRNFTPPHQRECAL